MTKATDRELINAAMAGRQAAYRTLMLRHEKGLRAYIGKLLAAGKTADAEEAVEPEDIYQETLNKAFLNLNSYNPDYEFSTWLYSIAKNRFIDYTRKRKLILDAGFCTTGEKEIAGCSTSTESSPEEKLINDQGYEKLVKHIDNLPELYKEIAVMRFINEFALQEIADKLSMPLNTVKTKVKRAKALLAKTIE